jgi:hypothetical protein
MLGHAGSDGMRSEPRQGRRTEARSAAAEQEEAALTACGLWPRTARAYAGTRNRHNSRRPAGYCSSLVPDRRLPAQQACAAQPRCRPRPGASPSRWRRRRPCGLRGCAWRGWRAAHIQLSLPRSRALVCRRSARYIRCDSGTRWEGRHNARRSARPCRRRRRQGWPDKNSLAGTEQLARHTFSSSRKPAGRAALLKGK